MANSIAGGDGVGLGGSGDNCDGAISSGEMKVH